RRVWADEGIGPYGGDGSAAVQTALCNPRAFHERPLTRRGPMWPARERWLRQMQRPQRSSDGGVDNPPVSLREPAPFTQGGLWGAAIQTASRSRHRAHYERPLRGADAQCAPLRRNRAPDAFGGSAQTTQP